MVDYRHGATSSPKTSAVHARRAGQGRRRVEDHPAQGHRPQPARRARRWSCCPMIVGLADLGPWPTKKKRAETIETTIWAEGIRLVNDVTFEPIKASDVEIGQLVNGEPENLKDLEGTEFIRSRRPKPRSSSSGWTRTPSRSPTPARTGRSAASSATPRSAPTSAARSACGSSRPTTCSARATSRPSTSATPGWWSSDRRRASLPQLPDHHRRRGIPRGPQWLHRPGRTELLRAGLAERFQRRR